MTPAQVHNTDEYPKQVGVSRSIDENVKAAELPSEVINSLNNLSKNIDNAHELVSILFDKLDSVLSQTDSGVEIKEEDIPFTSRVQRKIYRNTLQVEDLKTRLRSMIDRLEI